MPSSRRHLVVGIVISTVLIYIWPLALPTPLLEPDEGLHATISQEMLEQNEWIVPTFRGEAFRDKPILFFWAQMVSLKCFGMTEFAVRLPGLLFGILGGLTTGLLAAVLFDTTMGLLATSIALTMIMPLSVAQAAVHDVALVPWTNLLLLSLWKMESPGSRRRLWLIAAAGAFALAFLTKGLIGAAVTGVGWCAFLTLTRQLNVGTILRTGTALFLGALAASPWYLAMEARVPGYLSYYFIERHLMGFATDTQPHANRPWHYYAPYLTIGTLPWLLYLLPFLRHFRSTDFARSVKRQVLFLSCWFIGGVLFLSTASSKLSTYALPLYPAVAVLAALGWYSFSTGRLSSAGTAAFARVVMAAGCFGMAVPLIVLGICGYVLDVPWPPAAWFTAAALGVMSLLATHHFHTRRDTAAVSALSVWIGGLTFLVMTWPVQIIAESHSERELAQWVRQQDELPTPLVMIGEKPASILFYLTADQRARLRQGPLICQTIDVVASGAQDIEPGTVVAITRDALGTDAGLPAEFSRVRPESVGQFLIFRCHDDFREFVQVAWRPVREDSD